MRQRQAGRDQLKVSRPENYLLLLASVSPPVKGRQDLHLPTAQPRAGTRPQTWGWRVWRAVCTVLTLEVFRGLLAAVCPRARETHPLSPHESSPWDPEWVSPGQALETQERFSQL